MIGSKARPVMNTTGVLHYNLTESTFNNDLVVFSACFLRAYQYVICPDFSCIFKGFLSQVNDVHEPFPRPMSSARCIRKIYKKKRVNCKHVLYYRVNSSLDVNCKSDLLQSQYLMINLTRCKL